MTSCHTVCSEGMFYSHCIEQQRARETGKRIAACVERSEPAEVPRARCKSGLVTHAYTREHTESALPHYCLLKYFPPFDDAAQYMQCLRCAAWNLTWLFVTNFVVGACQLVALA